MHFSYCMKGKRWVETRRERYPRFLYQTQIYVVRCKHLQAPGKSAPGKSALLLCAGVRCESWYVSCVDFRWAATGSLAALIFVGFFKLRGLSQTPLRGCRFGGHRADDNGFQVDLSTLCLYGSRSKISASPRRGAHFRRCAPCQTCGLHIVVF